MIEVEKQITIDENIISEIVKLCSARHSLQNYIIILVETPEVIKQLIPKEKHTLADLVDCVVTVIDNPSFKDCQKLELLDAVLPLVKDIGILGMSLKFKRGVLINSKKVK